MSSLLAQTTAQTTAGQTATAPAQSAAPAKPDDAGSASTLSQIGDFLDGIAAFIMAALAVIAMFLFNTDTGRGLIVKAVLHGFFADDQSAAKLVNIIIRELRKDDRRAELRDLLKIRDTGEEDPVAKAMETVKIIQQMFTFASQVQRTAPKESP